LVAPGAGVLGGDGLGAVRAGEGGLQAVGVEALAVGDGRGAAAGVQAAVDVREGAGAAQPIAVVEAIGAVLAGGEAGSLSGGRETGDGRRGEGALPREGLPLLAEAKERPEGSLGGAP